MCPQTLRQRNNPRIQEVTNWSYVFSLIFRHFTSVWLPRKWKKKKDKRIYELVVCLGRSKSNQYPNTSLIQVEGVNTKEEVDWYRGKRLGYIYKAKVKKNGSHYRCIWGKITRPHGNSGVVRAKFKSNLPPKSMVALLGILKIPFYFFIFYFNFYLL